MNIEWQETDRRVPMGQLKSGEAFTWHCGRNETVFMRTSNTGESYVNLQNGQAFSRFASVEVYPRSARVVVGPPSEELNAAALECDKGQGDG